MSKMDHGTTKQDRTNTDENLKILQEATTGKPAPFKVLNAFKAECAIISERFDAPLAQAEEKLQQAITAAEAKSIAGEAHINTQDAYDLLTEQENRFNLIDAFYTTKHQFLRIKRKETLDLWLQATKGEGKIKVQRDILRELIKIKASIESADTSTEPPKQSHKFGRKCEDDPVIKNIKEVLCQIKHKTGETKKILETTSSNYDKAATIYEIEWAAAYDKIKESREHNRALAESEHNLLIAEREETLAAFTKKGKPLVEQEWEDWRQDKGLQLTDAFTRTTRSMIQTFYGVLEGVSLAIYTPFAEAAEGFQKPTKADAKRTALVTERAARLSPPDGP